MAQLGNFNPDAIEDDKRDFAPMPAGVYVAQIIESDLVATKTGTGQMLKLTFEIIEGPCAKRQVWENLNIVNANVQAQEIAQRALKRICNAVEWSGPLTDSNDLHFKPMRVRLGIEEDKSGQYAPKNTIKNYEVIGGAATAGPAYTPPAQSYAAAKAGGSRPWK